MSFQKGTITTSSIVATCLEELEDFAKDGIDEEAIRSVSATVFLGEPIIWQPREEND